jgi:L-threonylcarbamoyladenylate synthase
MEHLRLDQHKIDKVIDRAINVLRTGGIAAYPTETFYGLGVAFDTFDSLKRLYDLKRRPLEKAMPLIIGDIESLRLIVSPEWLESIPAAARQLMDKFWPGPLTLLMPAKKGLPRYLSADTEQIAVRIPGESFALELARKARVPITATSANPSGMPAAESADKLIEYFNGDIDLLVDGGRTPGGLPSTIADVSDSVIEVVREGVISRRDLESVIRNLQR